MLDETEIIHEQREREGQSQRVRETGGRRERGDWKWGRTETDDFISEDRRLDYLPFERNDRAVEGNESNVS